jgi:hypothetical protein
MKRQRKKGWHWREKKSSMKINSKQTKVTGVRGVGEIEREI